MKQDRIIGIALTIVNVILIIACIFFYMQTDKAEPVFKFEAVDIVYRSGMAEEKLLEGISAYDAKEGDVTDRVVIEKKIENTDERTLVVFYAVSDTAGNVAKCSKEFPAVYAGKKTEKDETEAKLLLEAGIDADLETSDKEKESVQENSEPIQTEMPTSTPEPTATPTPTAEPTPEPVAEAPQQPAAPPQNTVNPAAPVLTLKVSQVNVTAGNAPAWVNVIGTLKDDKDNYETLFRNLNVSKYDKNKPGSYQVSVYTEDSDGNKSQTFPLTIIVK